MNIHSPTFGPISLSEASAQIQSFIQEDPEASYKVIIGTDSQTTKKHTLFVSALIIRRVGKGARFFYTKQRHKAMPNLRHRIYKETELSLAFIDSLKKEGVFQLLASWPLEVHLDIGQEGETRVLIQEVVGWVTAVGYQAIIKPFSFGASSVADRFTS
ncbi:ribonuclease H-like YkuK family protein [Bacillus horti]|uniref:RNase H-related nuclease YkuK (DUF458 family) n=1 Tax=Caldalkalibacillus horti TaxID=77523 RepID=A0ABT9W2Q0_9BACI|nr:ribonuclease H-like YkuK family protein [Bacillus horti]MDQ0167527.1 putative RNase H-related nuclease YkuK (DUF458 family) [Bacillus horti]